MGKPMKAKFVHEVKKFKDIPNVGPAMERDFRKLGIKSPADLIGKDPYRLYRDLCQLTGCRQDPCVLDTYLAVIDFMKGAPAKPWYSYTAFRQKYYPDI
jgi:hypothetical protein